VTELEEMPCDCGHTRDQHDERGYCDECDCAGFAPEPFVVEARIECRPCPGCGDPHYVDGCPGCGYGIDGRFPQTGGGFA